jgi:hypothetical protein
MSGVLLLVLLAAPPPAPGVTASVAVEAGTGRVAIAGAGRIAVYEGFTASAPTATFDAPDGPLDLLEFRGGKLIYRFIMPETKAESFACVLAEDGRELVVFPNDGIGAAFPTAGARLTLDGKGLYQNLTLDGVSRAELGIPGDVPDGAGVIATYRFAGEKVAARFSEDFDGGRALAAGDLLIALRRGGLLRYRSGEGVVWRLDAERPGPWRILDVEPAGRVAVVLEGAAALVGLAVADGVELWRLDLGAPGPAWDAVTPGRPLPVVDARLLRDGGARARSGAAVLAIGTRRAAFRWAATCCSARSTCRCASASSPRRPRSPASARSRPSAARRSCSAPAGGPQSRRCRDLWSARRGAARRGRPGRRPRPGRARVPGPAGAGRPGHTARPPGVRRIRSARRPRAMPEVRSATSCIRAAA